VLAVEDPPDGGAGGQRAAVEHEGEGLAGRLELVVVAVAAELGEAAIEGGVLDEEDVEQLRAQVRGEGQREGEPLGQIERVLAQEAGVGGGGVAVIGRREVGEAAGVADGLAREVEAEPQVDDAGQPLQLALEDGEFEVRHHHSTCRGSGIHGSLSHDQDHGNRSRRTS
jgi:hypothetical protein